MAAGVETHGDELYCPTCEQTYARVERCPADNTRLVRIAQSKDQLIGRELEGRYTITQQLGQGGMGTVYRGTQHQLGREVAIKVVAPSLVKEPIVIKRFLREAKLASRLSHPNAVSVLDFGQTDDGLFFLVMELVAGRTLEDIITKDGRMPPARVVRIGTQICDALEGAHALQIIHRDLKPQNVMVMATGRDLVKVLDFGLAKSLSPDQNKSTMTMTNAGALLGTPAFMPPELVNGQDCDARSDLYSLGCVLYTCAAGRLPFPSTSVHEVIAAHASDPPPRIRDIPLRLWSIIEKLLEKDPAARYHSATEAREALEAALTDRPDTEPEQVNAPDVEKATMLGWDSSGARRSPATPARGVAVTSNPRPRISTPAGIGVQPKISVTPVPIPADQVDQVASSATMLSDSSIARNAVAPAMATPAPIPPAPIAPGPIPATPTAQIARSPKKLGWRPIALVLAAAIAAAVAAFVIVDGAKSTSKPNAPTPAKISPPPLPDKPVEQPAAVETKQVDPPAVKVETPVGETTVDVPAVTETRIGETKIPTKVQAKPPTKKAVEKKAVEKKPTDPKQQDPKPTDAAPPRRPVKTNPGVL